MAKPTRRARPVMRYFGGKWLLAPWIIQHFPPHHVYVEPFGGAASVLLRKERAHAEVYNELDGEITNLFRMLRDRPDDVDRVLRLTPYSRQEFKLSFERSDDPLEQARRTMVRSWMSFGSNGINRATCSGFRSNSTRSGSTPGTDWRNFPESLPHAVTRLQGVVIEEMDAQKCMLKFDASDALHYVDPPYVVSTRKTRKDQAYQHDMDDKQHFELLRTLQGLKGMVVVSGYRNDMYSLALEGWTMIVRKLNHGGKPREEILWLNPATQAKL